MDRDREPRPIRRDLEPLRTGVAQEDTEWLFPLRLQRPQPDLPGLVDGSEAVSVRVELQELNVGLVASNETRSHSPVVQRAHAQSVSLSEGQPRSARVDVPGWKDICPRHPADQPWLLAVERPRPQHLFASLGREREEPIPSHEPARHRRELLLAQHPPLGDRPDPHGVLEGHEALPARPERDVIPNEIRRLVGVEQDRFPPVVGPQHDVARRVARGDPASVRAECEGKNGLHLSRQLSQAVREGRRATLQRLEREQPRLAQVGQLQAPERVRHRRRGILVDRDLAEREKLARLRPLSRCHRLLARRLAFLPEHGRHDRNHCRGRHERRDRQPSATPLPPDAAPRGFGEAFFRGGETSRVALSPECEVPVGRPRPQQILGLASVGPELRRLPELVPKLGAVGVLGLPPHEPWPGAEQRLVNDLDALAARDTWLLGGRVEGGEQSGVHQLPQNLSCGLTVRLCEHRQQIVHVANGARALDRYQVAEDLAHHLEALLADPPQRALGVLCQRATDAADLLVGSAGQVPLIAVAPLPQLRRSERQQRQRAALALHLRQHLLDQSVVLEVIAALDRRLHQGAPHVVTPWRIERRELREQRPQRLEAVAVHQKVVTHAQKNVHVGLHGQTCQELGKRLLHHVPVEREQLFELVDDQQRIAVTAAPAGDDVDRHVCILEAQQLANGVGVTGELGHQSLPE